MCRIRPLTPDLIVVHVRLINEFFRNIVIPTPERFLLRLESGALYALGESRIFAQSALGTCFLHSSMNHEYDVLGHLSGSILLSSSYQPKTMSGAGHW